MNGELMTAQMFVQEIIVIGNAEKKQQQSSAGITAAPASCYETS